ncbi:MAG: mechanosensitive ion channel family protein [Alphaproteobacteria bacterium]|nr:mechanosensitive ion channel family protein [Alphaproteobacteria bacterium]
MLKDNSTWQSILSYIKSVVSVNTVHEAEVVFEAILLVCMAIFFAYLIRWVLKRTLHRLEKTDKFWDDILVKSALGPLVVLILIIGTSMALGLIDFLHDKKELDVIKSARSAGIVMCIMWFCIAYANRCEERFIARSKTSKAPVDLTGVDAFLKLMKVVIVVISCVVIMDIVGFDVRGILAFAGVGGVSIAFASKDLLSNFFGTIIIYSDKPFAVGDWIRSPDQNIEGIVEKIGWRMTHIRTFDKRPLYVPNSIFTHISLENPSRMSHRRIRAVIGVRYQDVNALTKILDEIRAMLVDHTEIDTNQTLIVNFEDFGESSVNFLLYTFTYTRNWVKFYAVRQDVMIKISDIIAKHKASIAYPTRTIEIADTVKFKSTKV